MTLNPNPLTSNAPHQLRAPVVVQEGAVERVFRRIMRHVRCQLRHIAARVLQQPLLFTRTVTCILASCDQSVLRQGHGAHCHTAVPAQAELLARTNTNEGA